MPTRPTFDVIFSPLARLFGPVVLVLSAILPPQGLGIDLCFVHRLAGVPCPGCGLTRSITNLTHGHLQQAVVYHPFGPVLYGVFLGGTVLALLPRRLRERVLVRARGEVAEAGLRTGYRIFLSAFLAFGLVRALAHQVTNTPF